MISHVGEISRYLLVPTWKVLIHWSIGFSTEGQRKPFQVLWEWTAAGASVHRRRHLQGSHRITEAHQERKLATDERNPHRIHWGKRAHTTHYSRERTRVTESPICPLQSPHINGTSISPHAIQIPPQHHFTDISLTYQYTFPPVIPLASSTQS